MRWVTFRGTDSAAAADRARSMQEMKLSLGPSKGKDGANTFDRCW